MIWYPDCTDSTKTHFDLYKEYMNMEPTNTTETNGISGIVKPKGVVYAVHTKTPPFYTRHIIRVKYKVVSQLSQPICFHFLI